MRTETEVRRALPLLLAEPYEEGDPMCAGIFAGLIRMLHWVLSERDRDPTGTDLLLYQLDVAHSGSDEQLAAVANAALAEGQEPDQMREALTGMATRGIFPTAADTERERERIRRARRKP